MKNNHHADTSVRITKFELEAFLSALLQFTRQYEDVLKQLDLAEANIQTVGEQIKQQFNEEIKKKPRRAPPISSRLETL